MLLPSHFRLRNKGWVPATMGLQADHHDALKMETAESDFVHLQAPGPNASSIL